MTRTFQNASSVLGDVMRPAYFVPESKPAVDLLLEMRQRRTPLTIVVDGHGGLVGIITLGNLCIRARTRRTITGVRSRAGRGPRRGPVPPAEAATS